LFKETSKLKDSIDFVVASESPSEANMCPDESRIIAAPPSSLTVTSKPTLAKFEVGNGCGLPFLYRPRLVESEGLEPKLSFLQATSQRIAIASMVMGSGLSYYLLHILSGHFFWHLSGVQTTAYMHSTIDASSVGVLVAMVCYAEFLHAFLGFKQTTASAFIGLVLAGLVTFAGYANGGAGGAIIAVICCLLCLGVGQLARFARLAIPPTFRASRAVLVAAAASIPATMLTLSALFQVITHPRPASYYSTYTPTACGDEFFAAAAIFFFLAVPAYAFVRCARTSEAKPLMALGLLQVSPLLVGFLAQLALLAPRTDGVPMLASGLITLTVAGTIVVSGAGLGAVVNGVKHRRKMMKAGI